MLTLVYADRNPLPSKWMKWPGLRTPPDTPLASSRSRRATPVRRRSALKARAPISESSSPPETPQYLASMDKRSSSIVAPFSDGKGAMLFSRAYLRSPSSDPLDLRPRSCNAVRIYRRNVDHGRRASWNNGSFLERAGGKTAQRQDVSNFQRSSSLPPVSPPPAPVHVSPASTNTEGARVPAHPSSAITGVDKVGGNRGTVDHPMHTDDAGDNSGNARKLHSAKEVDRDSDQETARSSSRENSPLDKPNIAALGPRKAKSHGKGVNDGKGKESGGGEATCGGVKLQSAMATTTTIPPNTSSTNTTSAPKHRIRRAFSTGSDGGAMSVTEFADKVAVLAADVVAVIGGRRGHSAKSSDYRGRRGSGAVGGSNSSVHKTSGR